MLPAIAADYNYDMCKLSSLILSACFLLAGCQSPDTESRYEQVSRQIEQLKAQEQSGWSTGGNIKIVVHMLTTNLNDYFTVDSLWRYVDDKVLLVRRPEVFSRSGLKIGVGGDVFKSRLNIVKRNLAFSEEGELFLVVGDGRSGYINIGTEIGVPRFFYLSRRYSGVGYEFRNAGKSLKVTARRLHAGLVELQLTPVFSRFLSTGGDIELTELTTTITARPGQPVVLGGSTDADDNVAAALFSYRSDARKTQTLITVTPYIQ